MGKPRKKNKSEIKKEKQEKYNADNEIIIGVTTVNKEKQINNKKSVYAKHINESRKRTSKKKKQKIKNNNNKNIFLNEELEKILKEKTIRKKNKKTIIISFIICMVIVVSGLIFVMTTPQFYIAEIEIEGNNKNSIETYISLTKIELNTKNIFAVSKNSISKNIKENPYVESVEVKRELPNKLNINIKEREVSYQVKINDSYIYIDKQGYILEISKEQKDITTLIGIECTSEEIKEGERLKNDNLVKLDMILKIVNQFKYNSIEDKITSIDISNKLDIKVIINNENKIVYLGDASSLSERILWLKTVLEKEGNNKGEIFINGNLNESKVYFKPIEG